MAINSFFPTDFSVKQNMVFLLWKYCLVIVLWNLSVFSPDSNNLAPVELNSIHLSDEDGSHSLIKRRAIHVDSGTHWENKTCHSLVDAQILL